MIQIGDLVRMEINRDLDDELAYGIAYAQNGEGSCFKIHWIVAESDWLGVYNSSAWFHQDLMAKV
jgi:hypothetical protein